MTPPRFEVIQSRPGRRIVIFCLVLLLSAACLALGYAFGHNQIFSDLLAQSKLEQELSNTQLRLREAENELIDARLNLTIQQEAANALRTDMTALHQQIQSVNEEVTFYKGLMAPGSLVKGLQVSALELTTTESNRKFEFEVLLTQVAQRRRFISGDLRIDVIGISANSGAKKSTKESANGQELGITDSSSPEAVLSLTELAEMSEYPLRFKFRYFQDLKGKIELPDGFKPLRVLVTAQQKGKDPLQVTFPWPTLG